MENQFVPYESAEEYRPKDFFSIIVREWNQETWELSPMKEVQFPKNLKSLDFAKYISEKLYPHIDEANLWGTRIGFLKSFSRSDLAMKKWNHMTKSANQPLGLSYLEITRDAILVVVKDNSKPSKEKFEQEELDKWANQGFIEHLNKKQNTSFALQHRDHDALLTATQNRKVDWNKNTRPEKAIKITVGQGDGSIKTEEQPMADEDEPIGIDFEPLF